MSKAIKLSRTHPLVIKVSNYYKGGIRGFTAMDNEMDRQEDWFYLPERLKRKIYNVVEKDFQRKKT